MVFSQFRRLRWITGRDFSMNLCSHYRITSLIWTPEAPCVSHCWAVPPLRVHVEIKEFDSIKAPGKRSGLTYTIKSWSGGPAFAVINSCDLLPSAVNLHTILVHGYWALTRLCLIKRNLLLYNEDDETVLVIPKLFLSFFFF